MTFRRCRAGTPPVSWEKCSHTTRCSGVVLPAAQVPAALTRVLPEDHPSLLRHQGRLLPAKRPFWTMAGAPRTPHHKRSIRTRRARRLRTRLPPHRTETTVLLPERPRPYRRASCSRPCCFASRDRFSSTASCRAGRFCSACCWTPSCSSVCCTRRRRTYSRSLRRVQQTFLQVLLHTAEIVQESVAAIFFGPLVPSGRLLHNARKHTGIRRAYGGCGMWQLVP